MSPLPPWPYPFWIAHRGAGRLAPENTLAAFHLGAAHGFRAFECDVKLSRDGVPYLLHDDTLDRTTSGRGSAGAQDWAALAALDAGSWHSAAHAGEPLLRLDGLAPWLRAHGMAVNLEIKPVPGTEAATGAAVALAARTLWADAAWTADAAFAGGGPDSAGDTGRWPLLSSFKPAALQAARDAAPEVPRALLLDRLPPDPVAAARALGCVAVVTQHRLMDDALCGALHAAGLRALCYTVNTAAEAQRLQRAGVDGLITDAVDRLGPGAVATPAAASAAARR
jgi:glycerophosphoryl diester phosphodiesterase